MNEYAEVTVLSEGPTEQLFVKQLLAPYLAQQGVYLTPVILDKPGQKGGDVKFARARNDIGKYLKQRKNNWITLFVDYYGIDSDWPGYAESRQETEHARKAQIMNQATAEKINTLFSNFDPARRFIPYISMYEIEALYFSDPPTLAETSGVPLKSIEQILAECDEPEKINDHPTTAPSKRLEKLSNRFKKTTTGIAIATAIGIPKMRDACPLFDSWVTRLENLPR
ncbi:MAG: DUF4276 family protein [Chlorobiaceae bacterium]|nr:DUF4276 family protein [Chlorobiaceae bacterium]